jgi:WD40 repeat protein
VARTDGSDLAPSVVRVLGPSDATCGAAFLVDDAGLLVTCAHVIEEAGATRGGHVRVAFGERVVRAYVDEDWWRDRDEGDLAFAWMHERPDGMTPVRLAPSSASADHRFRTFGFTRQEAKVGTWGYGKIGHLRDEAGRQIQLFESNEITGGYSGAPLFDEVTRCVVGVVMSIPLVEADGRLAHASFAVPTEQLFVLADHLEPAPECPYRDLASFAVSDARFWHGRGDLVERKLLPLIERGVPVIGVFGPSGSGKSSLLQAGLAAKLQRDPSLRLTIRRPVDDPYGWLGSETAALEDAVRHVLILDQLEDVFVMEAEVRARFFRNFTAAVEREPELVVVIGMRDDYISRLAAEAERLFERIAEALVPIPASLSRADLVAIVAEPARVARLGFDPPELPAIIADQAITQMRGAEPDTARSTCLPMLQVALTRLWELSDGVLLRWQQFQDIGLTGALVDRAEQTFRAHLDKSQEGLAERILLELIELGRHGAPDKGRRVLLAELRQIGPGRPMDAVLQILVRDRILVTSRDTSTKSEVAELIHDSLLERWARLVRLRSKRREFADWHDAMKQRATLYERASARSERRQLLLQGDALEVAERWMRSSAGVSSSVESLVIASQRGRRWRRARQVALGAVALAGVIALAFIARWYADDKRSEERAVKERNAEKLVQLAADYKQRDPAAALGFLAHAIVQAPDHPAVIGTALGYLTELRHLQWDDTSIPNPTALAFSPDGQQLAIGTKDGTVSIIGQSPRPRLQLFDGDDAYVWHLSFSPDGRKLLAARTPDGDDGALALVDVGAWDRPVAVQRRSQLRAARFDRDGNVVMRVGNAVVQLHDAAGASTETHILASDSDAEGDFTFAIGESGTIAMMVGRTLVVRTRDDREVEIPIESEVSPFAVIALAMSDATDRIAIGFGPELHLVDLRAGATWELPAAAKDRDAWITAVAFSHDGQRLTSAHWVKEGTESVVLEWDVEKADCRDTSGNYWTANRFRPDGVIHHDRPPCLRDRIGRLPSIVAALGISPGGDVISCAGDLFGLELVVSRVSSWASSSRGIVRTLPNRGADLSIIDPERYVVMNAESLALHEIATEAEIRTYPLPGTREAVLVGDDHLAVVLDEAGWGGPVEILDLETGRSLRRIDAITTSIAFVDGWNTLAVATDDAILLVHVESGAERRISTVDRRTVVAGRDWIAAQSGAEVVVLASADGAPRTLPIDSGGLAAGHDLLAIVDGSHVKIFEAASLRELQTPYLPVRCAEPEVALSPDDRWLLTTCDDPDGTERISIRNARTGERLPLALGDEPVPLGRAGFTPDGGAITVTTERSIVVVSLDPAHWQRDACERANPEAARDLLGDDARELLGLEDDGPDSCAQFTKQRRFGMP